MPPQDVDPAQVIARLEVFGQLVDRVLPFAIFCLAVLIHSKLSDLLDLLRSKKS